MSVCISFEPVSVPLVPFGWSKELSTKALTSELVIKFLIKIRVGKSFSQKY